MKIIVLGAHGQLGREICDILRFTKHDVTAYTRAMLDLEGPISPQALAGVQFDVLINAAAVHRVDDIERDPRVAFLVNAVAVEQLAKACALRSAHFIHVSTDYVFGDLVTRDFNLLDVPHTEGMPTCPVNNYGRSKALGERHALDVYPECTTIVRVAALFGRHGSSGKGGNFIETMLKAGHGIGPLRVVDDQIMSPTHAYDAALAIIHLMNHRVPGIFHVVNGGVTSWFGLAAQALRAYGLLHGARDRAAHLNESVLQPCSTTERPTPARRPAFSALSNEKLERYGFRMPHWTYAVEQYMSFRKQ